jgi:hypothetical protein
MTWRRSQKATDKAFRELIADGYRIRLQSRGKPAIVSKAIASLISIMRNRRCWSKEVFSMVSKPG